MRARTRRGSPQHAAPRLRLSMHPRRLLLIPVLVALAAIEGRAATPLELEWCTGSMPASWGFAMTASESCHRVHLRSRSPAVLMLGARPGPGCPEGWTVEVLDEREAMVSGPTPLTAGQRLETFLVVETNRATASIDARGAQPVEWGLWFADAAGTVTTAGKMTAAFPPVLPLADAASRGMVLLTVEPLGAAGPVEITVDNPTWHPLWLDLPTASVLAAEGREWVVASMTPFRMMRKQKTGRTVTAFPLMPPGTTPPPRRLSISKPMPSDALAAARDLATAADRLFDAVRNGTRPPAGAFERASPFDFWPLALRWATWTAVATPSPDLLAGQVGAFLGERAAAGDASLQALDVAAAVTEVEAAARAIAAEAETLRSGPLPMDLAAARERFR